MSGFDCTHEPLYIFRRIQRIKQTIGDAVVPIYMESDQGWMYILPAFKREQEVSRLSTAVKHGNVVKLSGILDPNLWVVALQIVANEIVRLGVPCFHHHQRLAI